jgi:hypothetical protein
MKIVYDRLANAQPRAVATATFKILQRLQYHQPHEQAAAAAIAFVMLCDHFRVPAQDVMVIAKNLLNERMGKNEEFGALRDYLRYDVKRD